jgi:hypothetical protein
MNKKEAKEIVYKLTAKSLMRMVAHPSRWMLVPDMPKDLTGPEKDKVAEQMRALAEKLLAKFEEKEPIDVKPH